MIISVNKLARKLIWLLTAFLFTTFVLFDTYAWGRYVFLGVCVLIVLLSAMTSGWRFTVRIEMYHIMMLVFVLYCAMSSLWAFDASDALQSSVTMAQTVGCAALLYIHYQNESSINSLLCAVKWAGYAVVAYCFLFYGLDTVTAAMSSARLENSFSNANRIAMVIALTCVIQFYEVVFQKVKPIQLLLSIPAIIIIASTQSRKALVLFVFGCVAILVVKNMQPKDIVKSAVRILLIVLGFALLVWLASLMPVFSGIKTRMLRMLASFVGEGKQDTSTMLRNKMVQLGWEWFKSYPLGGVGIGNPHILAAQHLGYDAYLHNNYIELLCGGGIVGAALYYTMYIYLLVSLIKYKEPQNPNYVFGIVWLALMLIMDWGMVSYYTRNQIFYLMIHFLNVNCLKKANVGGK